MPREGWNNSSVNRRQRQSNLYHRKKIPGIDVFEQQLPEWGSQFGRLILMFNTFNVKSRAMNAQTIVSQSSYSGANLALIAAGIILGIGGVLILGLEILIYESLLGVGVAFVLSGVGWFVSGAWLISHSVVAPSSNVNEKNGLDRP